MPFVEGISSLNFSSIETAIVASYVAFAGMYLVAKSIKPDSVV